MLFFFDVIIVKSSKRMEALWIPIREGAATARAQGLTYLANVLVHGRPDGNTAKEHAHHTRCPSKDLNNQARNDHKEKVNVQQEGRHKTKDALQEKGPMSNILAAFGYPVKQSAHQV
jgi:hypothetical protein